jgi:hypothetical protein
LLKKELYHRHLHLTTLISTLYLCTPYPELGYDAWVISMMTPIIELAKKDTELFELKYDNNPNNKKLLKLKFNIPKKYLPQSLDWSFSNLSNLYTIGYQSGLEFYNQYKNILSSA